MEILTVGPAGEIELPETMRKRYGMQGHRILSSTHELC